MAMILDSVKLAASNAAAESSIVRWATKSCPRAARVRLRAEATTSPVLTSITAASVLVPPKSIPRAKVWSFDIAFLTSETANLILVVHLDQRRAAHLGRDER